MVTYYPTFDEARSVRAMVRLDFPEARIVDFERGFAIQYRLSGGYYPDEPTDFDRFGTWDVQALLAYDMAEFGPDSDEPELERPWELFPE